MPGVAHDKDLGVGDLESQGVVAARYFLERGLLLELVRLLGRLLQTARTAHCFVCIPICMVVLDLGCTVALRREKLVRARDSPLVAIVILKGRRLLAHGYPLHTLTADFRRLESRRLVHR